MLAKPSGRGNPEGRSTPGRYGSCPRQRRPIRAQLRRTIRRSELRQIVPLADSTIYELERRGDFPQRFFLTARCVVWDLAEVEAWLRSRRQTGGADAVKKAPMPDVRQRTNRPTHVKG
jgi:prophage regulatory protein